MTGTGQSTRVSSGAENVGVTRVEDTLEGGSDVRFQQIIRVGFPAVPVKFVSQESTSVIGTNLGRDYPYVGDGTIKAANNATPSVTLDRSSGTPIPSGMDYTGCLICMKNGAAAGEVRRVVTYTGSSGLAILNRAFNNAPSAADQCDVWLNLWMRTKLRLKFEGSANNLTWTAIVALFGYNENLAASPALLVPVRWNDSSIPCGTGARNEGVAETSYFHGTSVSMEAEGFLGAKVHCRDLSAGSLSGWGCGT
jgi:hypothetical protein